MTYKERLLFELERSMDGKYYRRRAYPTEYMRIENDRLSYNRYDENGELICVSIGLGWEDELVLVDEENEK